MTTNDIKKAVYRQKPTAHLSLIHNGSVFYTTSISTDTEDEVIHYEIPVTDMGEAVFLIDMPANLLNRWIKN